MKILDNGHKYLLHSLDGNVQVILQFVKREGIKYPGNTSHYPGTTTQEVLRALINRSEYVNKQKFCWQNVVIRFLFILAIYLLELRHYHKHNLKSSLSILKIDKSPICKSCGHTKCNCNQSKQKRQNS